MVVRGGACKLCANLSHTWIYHCGRRETSWVNPASPPTATACMRCCAVLWWQYCSGVAMWHWRVVSRSATVVTPDASKSYSNPQPSSCLSSRVDQGPYGWLP